MAEVRRSFRAPNSEGTPMHRVLARERSRPGLPYSTFILFVSAPIFSISIVHTSPVFIHKRGVRPMPTPGGVPVAPAAQHAGFC